MISVIVSLNNKVKWKFIKFTWYGCLMSNLKINYKQFNYYYEKKNLQWNGKNNEIKKIILLVT